MRIARSFTYVSTEYTQVIREGRYHGRINVCCAVHRTQLSPDVGVGVGVDVESSFILAREPSRPGRWFFAPCCQAATPCTSRFVRSRTCGGFLGGFPGEKCRRHSNPLLPSPRTSMGGCGIRAIPGRKKDLHSRSAPCLLTCAGWNSSGLSS